MAAMPPLPLETNSTVVPESTRYYRTDSRISGVRTLLPQGVRVEHVSHEEFSGVATLTFDNERRDHVLKKVETIPGIREVLSLHIIKLIICVGDIIYSICAFFIFYFFQISFSF